jgi:hypothetical protein
MKVLLPIVLTCLIASTVWAQKRTLTYDFDDPAQLKDWEIVHGQWKVAESILRYEGGSKSLPFAILHKSDKWEFFTLEFKARVVKDAAGSYLGGVVRYEGPEDLHSFLGYISRNVPTGSFYSRPMPQTAWGAAPEDGHREDKCPNPKNEKKCACGWKFNACLKEENKGPHDGDWHEFKILVEQPKRTGQVRYAVWLDRQKDPVIDFPYVESPERGKFGLIGFRVRSLSTITSMLAPRPRGGLRSPSNQRTNSPQPGAV